MADPQPIETPQPATKASIFSRRSLNQFSLFAAGAGFVLLSTAITRRSLLRKYKATAPKFYQPNNRLDVNINGGMEAAEALTLATLNVASGGILMTGGLLWALDISSIEDMRWYVRTKMGLDASRKVQHEEEQELEEWFATVLERKEFKALRDDKALKDYRAQREQAAKDQDAESDKKP